MFELKKKNPRTLIYLLGDIIVMVVEVKKFGVNFIICMEVKFRGKNINEFVHIVMLSRYRKWKCY